MTLLARIAAYGLGLAVLGFLMVLALAGVPAAIALVVTAAGVLVMISLGSLVGGRQTPNRDPMAWPPPPPGSEGGDAPGGGPPGGTMGG